MTRSLSSSEILSKEEREVKLFYFAVVGDVAGTKSLLDNGVTIHATDYNQRTALHFASEKGHLRLVEFLIASGANVNAKDVDGESPLSLAVKRKHDHVELALRKAGASCHTKQCEKQTCAERSDRARFALMETFPRAVALAMLEGREVESIQKENVSIFFSDIVGYSDMTGDVKSDKLSCTLRSLFDKFDKLAYMHGVQKIDVIGDLYIAATNFVDGQSDDHAARLAHFAIDAMKAAHETFLDDDREASETVQIRIGMHCGAVSGTVVGCQSMKYTLMGDAVNTASRMMTTGQAGRIQCSEASAALIAAQAHDVVLASRAGGVEAKGKGHMATFWVSSLRRGRHLFDSCPPAFAAASAPCAHGGAGAGAGAGDSKLAAPPAPGRARRGSLPSESGARPACCGAAQGLSSTCCLADLCRLRPVLHAAAAAVGPGQVPGRRPAAGRNCGGDTARSRARRPGWLNMRSMILRI